MVKHFRAGVYHRTTARFVPLTSGVLSTDLEIKGPQAWRKRRPCNSGTIGTSSAGVKASGTTQQLWQFYSGTRRSEEHTSELQSRPHLVCRLLLEKKKK